MRCSVALMLSLCCATLLDMRITRAGCRSVARCVWLHTDCTRRLQDEVIQKVLLADQPTKEFVGVDEVSSAHCSCQHSCEASAEVSVHAVVMTCKIARDMLRAIGLAKMFCRWVRSCGICAGTMLDLSLERAFRLMVDGLRGSIPRTPQSLPWTHHVEHTRY